MKPIYNDRTHLRGISDKNIEIIYQYFKAPNIQNNLAKIY